MATFNRFKSVLEQYNKLSNRQWRKKQRLENLVDCELMTFVDYDRVAYNHIYLYIFHNVKGLEPLYLKSKERLEKQRKEERAYNENLKPIEKILKVGDVILDNEDYNEWVVIEVSKDNKNATIKKRKGRKEIDIRCDYNGVWEEVIEYDDGKDYELVFEEMFIKV